MDDLRAVLLGVLLLLVIYRFTRPRRPPIDLASRRFRPPWRSPGRGGEPGEGRRRHRLSFRR